MDARKRARLKSSGWQIGDVQEFLGLSDAEMRLIETGERLAETLDTSTQNSVAKTKRLPKPKE